MYSLMFLTGLMFIFVPHLKIPYGVEACSLWPTPDVCKNVVCPNGKTCHPYRVNWCEDKIMNVCHPPLAVCGDTVDPCAAASCPNDTICFSVKDQCNDNGVCTIKAQCEARNKPGTCPPPRPFQFGMCQTECENDAKCPSGKKCCPVAGFGDIKICD